MSHYLVYVIIPNFVKEDKVDAHIEKLMKPYDENLNVPMYFRDCYCVSRKADQEATEQTNKKFGTINELRETFPKSSEAVAANKKREYELMRSDSKWTEAETEEYEKLQKEINEAWRKHISAWTATHKELLDTHPMKGKADPKCSECKGKGKYGTKYNPRSKWDWYRVGGRFDGVVTQVPDESTDGGFNFDAKHQSKDKNSTAVDSLPKPIPASMVPFAILEPTGEWHEKGEMGWWGIVRDEKDDWKERGSQLLEKYRDGLHKIVALDVHI